MSDSMRATISELRKHLEKIEAEAIDTKRTINSLCRMAGDQPLFAEAELSPESSVVHGNLNGDEYYGKPLASVVRMILESRKAAGIGPATIAELYEQMIQGGYQFDAKNEENAKRGLRISIAKNTSAFHKIPASGKIGLLEWYPTAKDPKAKSSSKDDSLEEAYSDFGSSSNGDASDEAEEEVEATAATKPR